MFPQRRRSVLWIKSACIALFLGLNVAGVILLASDWSGAGDITAHACTAHATLMTNVTPDIHC